MSAVVIGGGLAGLSAALALQEAGEEVELYEASDDVGGRVRSDFVDGYILDRGFQLINTGYSEIQRLSVIEEIDFVPAERTVDVVTPMGVASIGDPRRNPIQALTSPLGSLREKIAVLNFLGSDPNSAISMRDALLASGCGDFYSNLLEPFLRGVFLTELDNVDSSYGREIMKSFFTGKSGLPRAGAGTLAEAIGARVETIHLGAQIDSIAQFEGKKIVVATDADTASRLLGIKIDAKFAESFTWYHSLPSGVISSSRLRVTSAQSPIVNSIAISNAVSNYAPENRTLISTSSLTPVSDEKIADEMSKFWGIPASAFELVKRYEIKNSLPIFAPAHTGVTSAHVRENIYRAGDYMTAGSQNGALLSGRLAAQELLAHQRA